MGIGRLSLKERMKAIARYRKRNTAILIACLVFVSAIAAAFGTGAMSRIASKSGAPISAADASGIGSASDGGQPPAASTSGTASSEASASSTSTASDSAASDPLKSILAKYTTDTVTFFQSFTTGSNQNAAFAFAGGDVWYIDASGAQKLDSGDGYANDDQRYAPVLWTVGDTRIFKFEEVAGGSGSISHAWYVKGGKPVELSDMGMNLSYVGSGQFMTVGQAFDWDFADGIGTGHTYKEYYLYWTADGLKEYGGLKITQQQLLKIKGAREILNAITESGRTVDEIYYRANNIININYHSGDKQNGDYDNVTLVYKNNAVVPQLIAGGQSSSETESFDKDNLSDFSYGGIYQAACFPEIATYPDKFPING